MKVHRVSPSENATKANAAAQDITEDTLVAKKLMGKMSHMVELLRGYATKFGDPLRYDMNKLVGTAHCWLVWGPTVSLSHSPPMLMSNSRVTL